MSNYKQDEALIKKNLSELTTRIGRLEQNISLGDDISRDWLNLQFSKLIRRIGILERAQDISTPDRFTEVYDWLEVLERKLMGSVKDIHDRISHAFDRLDNLTIDCADLGKDVKANKANFQAKGGILLRHREMTEEGLRDLNSRIERIERKLDESCHPFPESVSMDNKYRCPLCKTQQWVLATGFAMNCSCGAKLQLSHHGKIMCSFHKSYDAEVYKI